MRVGLASVEIQFFLTDGAGSGKLNVTPAELLRLVQTAMNTDNKGRGRQLVVRC